MKIEAKNRLSRGSIGSKLTDFLDPPDKLDFKFWSEHLRNLAIISLLSALGITLARHSEQYDPNFPWFGNASGVLASLVAFAFGTMNLIRPLIAIVRRPAPGGKRVAVLLAAIFMIAETMIVVGFLGAPALHAMGR